MSLRFWSQCNRKGVYFDDGIPVSIHVGVADVSGDNCGNRKWPLQRNRTKWARCVAVRKLTECTSQGSMSMIPFLDLRDHLVLMGLWQRVGTRWRNFLRHCWVVRTGFMGFGAICALWGISTPFPQIGVVVIGWGSQITRCFPGAAGGWCRIGRAYQWWCAQGKSSEHDGWPEAWCPKNWGNRWNFQKVPNHSTRRIQVKNLLLLLFHLFIP